MWIFMTDAMISIVTDPENPDLLLVRARAKGDIEQVFRQAKVAHTPERDYAYRARIPRKVAAAVISKRVFNVSTPNFKAGVKQDDRHDAYASCWSAMLRFQHGRKDRAKGQGLYRKRQIQHRLDLARNDDLDDAALGMPDWEPRRRVVDEDPEDTRAWNYMREKGWV